ncbi:hypothetical protein FNF29_04985 [Cafeteria roenbergensis]|uniref:HMG box domain-containing protein n=1 Tax=Cafeteria roenbergensis TaxID=33653 RepID=A0A5A8CGD5_CAFRO|nr:hypothetical protein FNF29_04985 [Cafeteria roenbergensis]|eukprot:KAA0150871.1 hypothetical protein FNF29_04985 [Cafeteria roenbergensis]
MDAKPSKKDEIKRMAMAGEMDAIEAKFGAKARAKAEAYRSKKLKAKPANDKSEATAHGAQTGKASSSAGGPDPKPSKPTVSKPKVSLGVKRGSEAPSKPASDLPATPPKPAVKASSASKPRLAVKSVKKAASGSAKPPKLLSSSGPKRPASAFFLFCGERRAALKSENPDAPVTDIARLLGQEWRALTEAQRRPFEEQAKSARERFAASSSTASRATGAKLATVRKRKPLAGRASPSSPTGAAGRTEVRRRGHLVFYSDGWIEDSRTGEPLWSDPEEAMPLEEAAMDYTRFEVEAGTEVVLVVPALLEFLETHKAELSAAKRASGLVCTLDLEQTFATDGIVFAVVESVGLAMDSATARKVKGEKERAFCSAVRTLKLRLAGDEGAHSAEPVSVPWLPADHDLVTVDAHVVTRGAYEETTLERELKPGMQVTRQFAKADDPKVGQVYEGRVYYVGRRPGKAGEDFPDSPYMCVRVVWYEQDRSTRRWFIKVDQTDNLASPWDLRTSSNFVHPSNVAAFAYDVPELGDAEQVLAYIGKTEPAAAFRERGSGGASGDAAVWLRAMERKCKQGHYAGSAGLSRLWEDFRLMISNAKRDNEEAYWEWRAADMLEAELRAVKRRMRDGAETPCEHGLGGDGNDDASAEEQPMTAPVSTKRASRKDQNRRPTAASRLPKSKRPAKAKTEHGTCDTGDASPSPPGSSSSGEGAGRSAPEAGETEEAAGDDRDEDDSDEGGDDSDAASESYADE